MKKITALILSTIIALGLAASAGSATMTNKLLVVMHDPGCHWFFVHGKYLKTYTEKGATSLTNMDENTLKIVSGTGTKYVKVGRSVKLGRDHYSITMVKQAADDNHLKLTIK